MRKLILFCFLLTSFFSSSQTIDAVADTNFVPISATTGGTTISVLNNDLMNNSPIILSLITVNAVQVPAGFTLNTDGTITVAANLPIGTYTVSYEICINNTSPSICDSASVTINILSSVFSLQNDFFSNIDGLYGQTTTVSILNNDTYNGLPIDVNNFTIVPLPNINSIIGLTFNPDGTLIIAPNTPQGTYYANYKLYENANPSNFAIASITIQVPYVSLDILPDGPYYVNGTTGGSTPSAFLNDTINGGQLLGNQVNTSIIYILPIPAIQFTINSNGIVTVPPNTPAGIYYVQYKTCLTYDGVCDQDGITINVINSNIYAAQDTITFLSTASNTTTTTSVFTNDFIDNTVPNGSNVSLTAINLPIGFNLNANGTISVASGTPQGNYTFSYQICEISNPNNCSTSTVNFELAYSIVANSDSFTFQYSTSNSNTTPSVLSNDFINGFPVTSNIILSLINSPSGLTFENDGTITVAAGTLTGIYTINYQICEILNPNSCSVGIATVIITPNILPNPDAISYYNTPNGGNSMSVLENDTINTFTANEFNVLVSSSNLPSGFTLNNDGTITVALGTAPGNYSFTYQICDSSNPNNCSSSTANFVLSSNIQANPDAITLTTPPNGNPTSASVLTNDKLNGFFITNPNLVFLTAVSFPSGIVLNSNGTLTIPSSYTTGNYILNYQLCQAQYSSNCVQGSVSLVIVSPFAPTGPLTQNVPQSGTLAGLQVTGQNIQWYSTATNKSSNVALASAIPSSTPVVVGTTYYATQTVNGIESTTRLPVTISALSNNNYAFEKLIYYPNPVKNSLTITNLSTIDKVEITSILGQRILTKKTNDFETELNLSELSNGVYFVKVNSEGQEKIIKILKE
ncbi:T9SS type A sorting domain-containing protein [Flavobacterium sp.]|uniref:T9SS type A sorting domain-containing protein n=1 Tax=Flavobacterium sp. TaxID=239 RepID=UPI0026063D03|nr:T9SS type A sorting domain-containing protein [Flavobacterium sp.]